MRAADWLRALANTLPPDGAVMLTSACLRQLLDGEADDGVGTDATELRGDPTAAEVAEALGRSPSTIRAKCAAGEIDGAYRMNGREWRIPREAFRTYVEAQRTGAGQRRDVMPATRPLPLNAWRSAGNGR